MQILLFLVCFALPRPAPILTVFFRFRSKSLAFLRQEVAVWECSNRCLFLFWGVCWVFGGVCLSNFLLCVFGLLGRNVYKYRGFRGFMFDWFFGGRAKKLEDKTKEGFESVKKDFERVGAWVKHLDRQDKQLFDLLNSLKIELASTQEDIDGLREGISLVDFETKNKQLLKKSAVLRKQTAVCGVQEPVQTAVQTGNFYDILNNFSSNERLLIFTLANVSEGMKLSYEDLARLLGKERSTIRGQINVIKQKSEGLLLELTEPNGKKRVFVSEEVRNKLLKYAKVRVAEPEKKHKKQEKKRKVREFEEEMSVGVGGDDEK